MKKAEIIAGALKQVREANDAATLWTGPEASYEAYLALALARKFALLPSDIGILTRPDFANLKVNCCPACHGEYPDELEFVEFQPGKYAWVCCAISRKLR